MDSENTSAQLLLANKELAFQNEEKEKRAAELIIANTELAFQNVEKEKRAAELLVLNEELVLNNKYREDRAAELILANIELSYQNDEKEKRAAELIIANKELEFQNQEKEKRSNELTNAYSELKKAEEHLKEHILGLEEMMFITSHKVRKPVANILGLTSMLDLFIRSPAKLKELVNFIKVSAEQLDAFTRELTEFISNMEGKGKKPPLNL